MADNQAELHRIGRLGEDLAKKNGIVKGRRTKHNHPFDYVDHHNGTADEVKTMRECDKDIKVHIDSRSFRRKLAYAEEHDLKTRLVLLLIDENDEMVASYTGKLTQHVRPSGLDKTKPNGGK